MNPQQDQQTQALTETRAVPDGSKAVTKFTAEHGREIGLPSPEAINFMMSVANMLTHSALITPDMGNNVEQIKANAMAKMLVAHEMGIPALQGLQEIDIVKGKIFVRYPQLIAQMMKKGLKLEWIERSDKAASLKVTPPEGALMLEETFEFTIEDARRAGLIRDGSQYLLRPRVMLCSRVVSEAFRMTGGLSSVYTPEEREEITAPDREQNHQEPEKSPFIVSQAPKPEPENSKSGQAPTIREDRTVQPSTATEAVPAAAMGAPPAQEAGTGAPQDQPRAVEGTAITTNESNNLNQKMLAGSTTNTAQPAPPAQAAPAAAPKGRGRGKAATEPPAPVAQAAGFAASDDDLPREMKTAPAPPKPEEAPKQQQKERLEKIVETVARQSGRDHANVREAFVSFIKVFQNHKGPLPAIPNIIYEKAIPWMEGIAAGTWPDLLANPRKVGEDAGAGEILLKRKVSEWPQDLQDMAYRGAQKRCPLNGGMELVNWLDHIQKEGPLPLPDITALVGVYGISAAATSAVVEAEESTERSFSEILSGVDLKTAKEVDVLTAIAGGSKPAEPKEQNLWED